MVFFQSLDVVVERVKTSACDKSCLPHSSSEDLSHSSCFLTKLFTSN